MATSLTSSRENLKQKNEAKMLNNVLATEISRRLDIEEKPTELKTMLSGLRISQSHEYHLFILSNGDLEYYFSNDLIPLTFKMADNKSVLISRRHIETVLREKLHESLI